MPPGRLKTILLYLYILYRYCCTNRVRVTQQSFTALPRVLWDLQFKSTFTFNSIIDQCKCTVSRLISPRNYSVDLYPMRVFYWFAHSACFPSTEETVGDIKKSSLDLLNANPATSGHKEACHIMATARYSTQQGSKSRQNPCQAQPPENIGNLAARRRCDYDSSGTSPDYRRVTRLHQCNHLTKEGYRSM